MEEDLIGMLVPPEAGDECDVVLEIRAGVGGDEARLHAAERHGVN